MTLPAGWTWHQILGFTVVGALISTFGTLLATLLKERFFARSHEVWKAQVSSEAVFRHYRDPLLLAAMELATRLEEIYNEYPTAFLTRDLLTRLRPGDDVLSENDHLQRYKLLSSLYRFASFLGWLELLRQDLVFVGDQNVAASSNAQNLITAIRRDMADSLPEVSGWHDVTIFREEQRAIGESMLQTINDVRVVMGYADFSKVIEAKSVSPSARWFRMAAAFLSDHKPPADTRVVRFRRLLVHLIRLVEALDPSRINIRHRAVIEKHGGAVEEWNEASRLRLSFAPHATTKPVP